MSQNATKNNPVNPLFFRLTFNFNVGFWFENEATAKSQGYKLYSK
jgi:hypothetical protein